MLFDYMKDGEEIKVARLVSDVFMEFEAPGYKQEGITEFMNFISPENIAACCASEGFFVICCKDNDEIVGVIAVRDYSHISLLFVDKKYHRKGIGRKLFMLALEKCCSKTPSLKNITVNSSPYAVEIYKKMGFEITSSQQEKNGIKFTPMKFIIS